MNIIPIVMWVGCAIPYTYFVGNFVQYKLFLPDGLAHVIVGFSYLLVGAFVLNLGEVLEKLIRDYISDKKRLKEEKFYAEIAARDRESAIKDAERIKKEEEKRRIENEKAREQEKVRLESLRIQYELDRPQREQAAKEERERLLAQKYQEEQAAKALAEKRDLEEKKQREEQAIAKRLAEEEAYWNSPEGRQVKVAKDLAAIRAEEMRQQMELDVEKEKRLAEIRKQALEEELRIMEKLHAKTKGR